MHYWLMYQGPCLSLLPLFSCFHVLVFVGGCSEKGGRGGLHEVSEQQQGRGGHDLLWSNEPNIQGVSSDPNLHHFFVNMQKMGTVKDP